MHSVNDFTLDVPEDCVINFVACECHEGDRCLQSKEGRCQCDIIQISQALKLWESDLAQHN